MKTTVTIQIEITVEAVEEYGQVKIVTDSATLEKQLNKQVLQGLVNGMSLSGKLRAVRWLAAFPILFSRD